MKTIYLLIQLIILLAFGMFSSCEDKVEDTTAPILVLKSPNPFYLAKDSIYIEPGFTAVDDVDGDINTKVIISGVINSNIEGDYTLYYNVSDKAGNKAIQKTRTVRVMIF